MIKEIRTTSEFHKKRKVTWGQHCGDPGTIIPICIFLALGLATIMGTYDTEQIKNGCVIAAGLVCVSIWFLFITKYQDEKGNLINSHEAFIEDISDTEEQYNLIAGMLRNDMEKENKQLTEDGKDEI